MCVAVIELANRGEKHVLRTHETSRKAISVASCIREIYKELLSLPSGASFSEMSVIETGVVLKRDDPVLTMRVEDSFKF